MPSSLSLFHESPGPFEAGEGAYLTLDIGNSRVSAALHIGVALIRKKSVEKRSPLGSELFDELLAGDISSRVMPFGVSSVVPTLNDEVIEISQRYNLQPHFLSWKTVSGLCFDHEDPATLGNDRIADSLGALLHHAPPLLVIDSGTATTFDLIDGQYCHIGGAIAPGLNTMLKSLSKNTAQLKTIPFLPPTSILAKNTADSIRVGVYSSFIAGIERLIGEYRGMIGPSLTVLATGGTFEALGRLPEGVDHFEPDLIHLGLRKWLTGVL